MKKISFFSFSWARISRAERVGWGALLILVIGFNVFASQVETHAATLAQGFLVRDEDQATTEPAKRLQPTREYLPVNVARQPRRVMQLTLTAYTSLPGLTDGSPFITANGSHVQPGTIAANCLPFGAKVQFPELYGDQIFVVEDRLHPRKGCAVIDVWLPTYNEAKQFGVKYTAVHVL